MVILLEFFDKRFKLYRLNFPLQLVDLYGDIVTVFGLEAHKQNNLCRVKYILPKDGDFGNLSKWELHIDEREVPPWWNYERARRVLDSEIEKMLVDDRREVLAGGTYLLYKNAMVSKCVSARILGISGLARISNIWDTKIWNVYDQTEINHLHSNVRIQNVRGSAVISYVGGNSWILDIYDYVQIRDVGGSAMIWHAHDNVKIKNVSGNATFRNVAMRKVCQDKRANKVFIKEYRYISY